MARYRNRHIRVERDRMTGGAWGVLDPPVTQENRLNAGYGYVAEAVEDTLTDPGVLCQATLLKFPKTSLQADWQQCAAPLSTNSDTKLQFYSSLSYQASVLTAAATSGNPGKIDVHLLLHCYCFYTLGKYGTTRASRSGRKREDHCSQRW
ncbi:hypothetical protein NDU88_003988 [Pleurodeles waltl]|uniref:Uncharacterized protein n=1 Tax=Pleurodeles waltl TaxID=8319 RepID=A0AAV7W8I9_PLEWA|nr:hypothetical protein NDU88_003988 [Pleurodeles waltl]